MKEIKNQIAEYIKLQILKLDEKADISVDEIEKMLEYPPDSKLGDLAMPCFRFSKLLRRSPVMIAEQIASNMTECEAISKVEAVNGYLNIYICNDYLCKNALNKILNAGEKFGGSNDGAGKCVVLDYSSPNVAKPFHIGHLGTTVIGHSLKRLHEFAGYKCVGINYLGDWGTQFGKLIVAYRLWGNKEEVLSGGVDKLVELYVKFHNEIENDSSLSEKARLEFHKLENGDKENLSLWKWFIEISLIEYQKTYKQLGIEFDSYLGESFYTDKMPEQIEKLKEMQLLKVDDGASLIDLEAYGMPPCLVLKSDGSTLYPTRDIAAAVYRKKTYDFEKCIYVTSAAQSLHFAQLFKVVELMGYEWYDKLVHVPYGTVSINGEKLATRTGNVILLKDLFKTAIDKVSKIMIEKNPNLPDRERIAESVGVGAVVFYYLSSNRIRDINFVLEDALNFDGNTGPYVQYTYARASSMLSKFDGVITDDFVVTADEEAELLKTLSKFPEKVVDAINEYEPSIITRYILDVASDFNKFYHNCHILSAEDKCVKNTRVALTKATKTVLGNAFGLICMEKTEKI